MQCTINEKGQIEIKPVRSIETYALNEWLKNNPDAWSLGFFKFHGKSVLEELDIE